MIHSTPRPSLGLVGSVGLVGLTAGILALPAIAQETLKVAPAKGEVLEYTIKSKSSMDSKTVRKVDGEERAGRGAGVGGPVSSTQTVVFCEGPAGSGWREYQTAEASVTRSGRDGAAQTSKIVGALDKQKVKIGTKDGAIVLTSASADGKAIPPQVAAGIPATLDLAGLLPDKAIAVDGEYELGKGFAAALSNVMHPVRAARTGRGQGAGRGQGGNRGRGGDRGQGGRQGRAAAGNATAFETTLVRILASKKLDTKGSGKLVSVEEKNGHRLATVAIEGVISGKGTPEELGLTQTRGAGRRGSGERGGRGGQAVGGAAPVGEASLTLEVNGTLVIDQTENRLASMNIRGALDSNSTSTRTTNRGGEAGKIETQQSTKGTFEVALTCTNKGAPKQDAPKQDGLEKK